MSGPREPWRSKALGLTADQLAQRSLHSLRQRSRAPGTSDRATRERDRSLNGKARIRARRAS